MGGPTNLALSTGRTFFAVLPTGVLASAFGLAATVGLGVGFGFTVAAGSWTDALVGLHATEGSGK